MLSPIIWGTLWQCFGAAIALPLYFSRHLTWVATQKPSALVPAAHHMQALPASFLLGAVLPGVIGMMPAWVARSPFAHQNVLAAWQPDPLWVSLLQTGGIWLASSIASSATIEPAKLLTSTRRCYLLAATSSALGHMYVMLSVLGSDDPQLGFARMYVPHLYEGPTGASASIFVRGPWLFLQYDLIIIALSCLSWVYVLLASRAGGTTSWKLKCFAGIVLVAATLGPGAAVSLALWVREGQLVEEQANTSMAQRELKI